MLNLNDFSHKKNEEMVQRVRALREEEEKNMEYGIPEERKYPLYDKEHVISAIKLFGHVSEKYEEQLAHKIISKMKEYDISYDMVGKDNRLYKYLPEKELQENFKQAYRDGGEKYEKYLRGQAIAIDKHNKHLNDGEETLEGKAEKNYQARALKKCAKTDPDGNFQKGYRGEKAGKDSEVTRRVMGSHNRSIVIKGKDSDVLKKLDDKIKTGEKEVENRYEKQDKRFPEDVPDNRKSIKESVLDPVHKEKCQELWDADNKLKPEVKKFILDTLETFEKSLSYSLNIKGIYLIGSSTGYQYTETSDIDCTVVIAREFSDTEYDDFMKVLPNGHDVPGTHHPVNYFFTSELVDHNCENIYDVKSDSWIKETPKEQSELPTGYILELAKFFMNSLDLTFNEYARDKQEYLEYKSMDPNSVDISEKEKHEAMDKKMTEIKADLDSLRIGNHVIRGFLHEAYESDDNQYAIHITIENPNKDPRKSINNLVYKCLEKFGYRTKLDSTIAEAEAFIEAECPSEKDETTDKAELESPVDEVAPIKEEEKGADNAKNDVKFPYYKKTEDGSCEVSIGSASNASGDALTESVTFIDNAGNLKTMSAKNYNKDMHEYHTDYQIKKFRIRKSPKKYTLNDDEKE